MIVADLLREFGSKAQVVAMFQLSTKSQHVILPEEDRRLLKAMNVHVYYIPKHPSESFYRVQYDKFRILSLTDYDRVIFMDTDVVPIANMDYLFELSMKGVLKENFIIPGGVSPANGGFFMMQPNATLMEQLDRLIRKRHDEARTMPFPHFDPIQGWGHVIRPPDKWQTTKRGGHKWTFKSAYAGQGLLYHWVKYEQKSVSIIRMDGFVENWGRHSETGEVELQQTIEGPFPNIVKTVEVQHRWAARAPPFAHFIHMVGNSKPWRKMPGPETDGRFLSEFRSVNEFWFYRLAKLNKKLDMNLDFANWRTKKEAASPLGKKPSPNSTLTADVDVLAPLYRDES